MRSLTTVCARLRSVAGKVATLVLAVSMGTTAQAEWQDPLETPAMKSLKAPFNMLLDVASAGNRLIAVGDRGHIILSDDDGYSWKQAKVPVMTPLTSVYFADPRNGWAVGHDAVVLHTNDGGENWVKQFDGFIANELVLEQAKKQKAEAQTELNKAKVMGNRSRISDAEEELENRTFALEDAEYDYEEKSTKPLLDLWFKNAREGFVVGAYGMIFKTIDGGSTWTDWSANVENPDRFHINAIAHAGDNRLMMVGEMGLILRSLDGGNSWTQTFSPYEGSYFGVLSLNNHQVQLAFGLRGNLARTESFGSNWRLENTGTEQSLIGGTDRRGRVAYVVGNGGAFTKGIDQGQKWDASVREGRTGAAAIVETQSGHFVIVGEQGVELVDKSGKRVQGAIKSLEVNG